MAEMRQVWGKISNILTDVTELIPLHLPSGKAGQIKTEDDDFNK